MTGQQALGFLDFVEADVLKKCPYCTIKRRSDWSVLYGDTDPSWYNNRSFVQYGTKEFSDHKDDLVSDMHVLGSVVSLFHEAVGHGFQNYYMRYRSDDPLCVAITMNVYARRVSDVYYMGKESTIDRDSPYWSHCHEIAAQYCGLKYAYDYLKCVPGLPFDVDSVLCEYQNYRLVCGDFIKVDGPVNNIDQIFNAYRDQFAGVVRIHHRYDGRSDDVLSDFWNEQKDSKYETWFSECQDGMKQDWMAVSVYNYYFHDLPPALEHIRMDPQYAFGKFSKPVFPIPSKSVLKLSRLTDMMDSEEVKKKIEFEFSE